MGAVRSSRSSRTPPAAPQQESKGVIGWLKDNWLPVGGVTGVTAVLGGAAWYFGLSGNPSEGSQQPSETTRKLTSAAKVLGPLAAAAGVAGAGYYAWNRSRQKPVSASSDPSEERYHSARPRGAKKKSSGVNPVLIWCLIAVGALGLIALIVSCYSQAGTDDAEEYS